MNVDVRQHDFRNKKFFEITSHTYNLAELFRTAAETIEFERSQMSEQPGRDMAVVLAGVSYSQLGDEISLALLLEYVSIEQIGNPSDRVK